MLRTIAVIVQEPVAVFELGTLAEVFGIDRTDDGVPAFDFRVCSETPGQVLRSTSGPGIVATHALEEALGADLVAIPGGSGNVSSPVASIVRRTWCSSPRSVVSAPSRRRISS